MSASTQLPDQKQDPIYILKMYSSQRQDATQGTSISTSHQSLRSQDSRSTASTSIRSYDPSPLGAYHPRTSTETYASTVASLEELCEEPESFDADYEVPEYRDVVTETDLRPTNPQDFADYFPSTRRLFIKHDDTSSDGNLNLRVDTEVSASGRRKENVQLFHMRMYDLKKREFSLRRYERSSGREVCHSSRKYTKPAAEQRPAFTRSMSTAFATLRRPDFKRTNSGLSTHSQKSRKNMRRQDSGYASHDEEEGEIEDFLTEQKPGGIPIPTNTTRLEFSNYAQVEVERRGKKSSSKRYEFEYWGHTYTWRRTVEKDGAEKAVSYHLYKGDDEYSIAHIIPELRSATEMRDEAAVGGWVPPCSMWISDKGILEALTDVAE